jgi:hypothetical protein
MEKNNMSYRCVKSNTTNEVLAIGMDDNQGGVNYHDIGTWCNFTFDEIPEIPTTVLEYAEANGYSGNLHKVVDDTIISKTIEDIA